MAITETRVHNSYDGIVQAIESPRVLSDGTLAVYVMKANGSNWDSEIYASSDGGATWTQVLTIITNTTFALRGWWIGDSLYIGDGREVNNTPLLFYRADYDKVPQSWALGVNGSTIRSAVASESWGRMSFDREAGGRLWCAYDHLYSGGHQLRAAYSDNNGTSWTDTTLAIENTNWGSNECGVKCLEFKTVIVWLQFLTAGSTNRIAYVAHTHTDSVNTWSSLIQVVDGGGWSLSNFGYMNHGNEFQITPKKIYGIYVDSDNTPERMKWWKITEDGSGNLSVASSTTWLDNPSGETVWARITGYKDGFIVFYTYSGSLGTMRRRSHGNSDTDWTSESTWVLTNTPNASSARTPRVLNANRGDPQYFLSFANPGSAPNRRPWVIRENLPVGGNFLASRVIPLSYLTMVQVDRVVPVWYAGKKEFNRQIPVHYWINGLLWINRIIPVYYTNRTTIDRVIPVYYQVNPGVAFDRQIPIAYVALKNIDRVIPIYYDQVRDWIREIDAETEAYLAEILAEVSGQEPGLLGEILLGTILLGGASIITPLDWVKEDPAAGAWE